MDGTRTIRIRKTVLYLWIMTILVICEVALWSVSRLGIWINDIWTFLTLGVMGIAILFIRSRSEERAEREATELFLESNKHKKEKKLNE
jgi:uncharacterized protein (DUF58 family)